MKEVSKPSSANIFLRQAMERYDEQSPPNPTSIANMEDEFNRRLDEDFRRATSDAEKKKLKALAVGGAHAFDQMRGTGSNVTLETFRDLVGIATGERAQTGLEPTKPYEGA